MKNILLISFIILISIISIISCKKDKKNNSKIIIHNSINKEFILKTNISDILASNDEVSNHIDSILNGQINEDIISTGEKNFDLNNDRIFDIGFEIIDLNKFNTNNLPDTLDSLAARVIPKKLEILDNSTYNYCDALNKDDIISNSGNWTSNTCVLGTFLNAGLFNGKGEKYLAFRFNTNSNYKYGWIKIYCSNHNDTLRIIDYAYNDVENSEIKAGQID